MTGVGKYIELNPHLPFIYLPEADWSHFAYTMNDKLLNQAIDCSYPGNYCRFDYSCDRARGFMGDQKIKIQINDGEDDFDMYIPLIDLLAPGSDFGDSADYCYVGVFMSKSGVQDLWEIGSKFFRRYYVVYDASGM